MDEWIARSWRRIAVLAAVSGLLFLSGYLGDQELARRQAHRVKTGVVVSATVTRVEDAYRVRYGVKFQQAVVEYTFAGKGRSVRLMNGTDPLGVVRGQVIDLYVDPTAPTKAATRTGLVSEGKLTLLPSTLYVCGSIGLLFIVIASLVRLVASRRKSADEGLTGQGKPSSAPSRSAGRSLWPESANATIGKPGRSSIALIEVEFEKSTRGYDVEQVDAMVRHVIVALDSRNPATRTSTARAMQAATFSVCWGGYDRAQVDSFMDQSLRELLA